MPTSLSALRSRTPSSSQGEIVEVVRDDPSPCQQVARILPATRKPHRISEEDRSRLPIVPIASSLKANVDVGRVEKTVIALKDTELPEIGGKRVQQMVPFHRKEAGHSICEPLDFRRARGGDAGKHDLADARWMCLCVGKRQRRTPSRCRAATTSSPAADVSVSRCLRRDARSVLVPRSVAMSAAFGRLGTAIALIEEDDAVNRRVKITASKC